MRSNKRGFTLVEMLITVAILASVLVTAGTFLITSNRSQRAAVDLGSSIDRHAFVANILNYDFRIACYGVESEDCSIDVSSGGQTAEVEYYEDRFGENTLKTVDWTIEDGDLVRGEHRVPNLDGARAIILRDITSFKVTRPSRQLISFEIVPAQGPPIHVNVAVLNPIPPEGQ